MHTLKHQRKARAIDRYLGTSEWRQALYSNEQGDFFDGPCLTRDTGTRRILEFITTRLKSEFAHVEPPMVLGEHKRAPLFALYFAVSNDSPNALALAARVSKDILSKLRL